MSGFLLYKQGIDFGTSARQRRAIDLLINNNPQALGAVEDYFSTFAKNLELFDFELDECITFEILGEKLKEMLPARDEIVGVFWAIAKYIGVKILRGN